MHLQLVGTQVSARNRWSNRMSELYLHRKFQA
jgi:hypothetical protein